MATSDWFDDLSQEEIESMNRGIADHENEDVLTSKEFWAGYGDKL